MRELRKIFISHHHNDATALSQLKDRLEPIGFACFLAHKDITPGEHDLERIEKEIRECDAFVYVGSKDANASEFCQQEIGMAKALDKEIITAMTLDNPPKGFIARIQAIRYKAIDTKFCNNVGIKLADMFPPAGELKKNLDALGYKGFSRTAKPDTIHLVDDSWDDFSFSTAFRININRERVGHVKIAFLGQPKSISTHSKLPQNFTHLQLPFFSRVLMDADQTALNPNQVTSLKYLLNDTEFMSDAEQRIVKTETVYEVSLFRQP